MATSDGAAQRLRHLTELLGTITSEEWRTLRGAIAHAHAYLPEPTRSERTTATMKALLEDGSLLRLVLQRRAYRADRAK